MARGKKRAEPLYTTRYSNNTGDRYDHRREQIGKWTSFYRENPHRFAIDYLNMKWLISAPFQQIIINILLKSVYVMIIASRGLGKSQLVAAAMCVKCILYPETKIVLAAGVRSQSLNALKKITDEFMPNSVCLRAEVDNISTSAQDAYIRFLNGSIIKVATASDNARSARANVVVADEFIKIKKEVIDKVIRKFKAAERHPPFYSRPCYTNDPSEASDTCKYVPQERNQEIYISSAGYKWHYSWAKFQAYVKAMLKGESYFVCGFPYQLPVSAGYYPLEQVQEEMQEDDFDEISWSINISVLLKFIEPFSRGVCHQRCHAAR